jgi:phosphoribosylanthranilate isomerase
VNAPRRTRIKFCGCESVADIALAVEAGADAVGIIVADSPRRVDLELLPMLAAAVPAFVTKVGVLAGQGEVEAAALRALGFTLQFSGDESAAECEYLAGGAAYLKAFHVRPDDDTVPDFEVRRDYRSAMWMFDSRVDGRHGGTGVPFLWQTVEAAAARRAIVISGGLTPSNVATCVRAVRPHAVDVRSGIETAGRKDPEKMHAFVRAVRAADESAPLAASLGAD